MICEIAKARWCAYNIWPLRGILEVVLSGNRASQTPQPYCVLIAAVQPEQDAWDYVHNSYGLLRTPWNMDSTPFVTRHNMTNGVVRRHKQDELVNKMTARELYREILRHAVRQALA